MRFPNLSIASLGRCHREEDQPTRFIYVSFFGMIDNLGLHFFLVGWGLDEAEEDPSSADQMSKAHIMPSGLPQIQSYIPLQWH